MDAKKAAELVENQFSFDVVGPAMMKVRKNLDNAEICGKLVDALNDAAVEAFGGDDPAALAAIREAAVARVAQYVESCKAGKGKGCS